MGDSKPAAPLGHPDVGSVSSATPAPLHLISPPKFRAPRTATRPSSTSPVLDSRPALASHRRRPPANPAPTTSLSQHPSSLSARQSRVHSRASGPPAVQLPPSTRPPANPERLCDHDDATADADQDGSRRARHSFAMGRSKKGVRFPHNNKNTNGAASGSDGRRSSLSDVSEEGGGSPTKSRAQAQAQDVCNSPVRWREEQTGREERRG